MISVLRVASLLLLCGSVCAQTVKPGDSIPNPFPFPLNFQIAMPDPSNPIDPWKEVTTGVAPANGGAQVPVDPSLCGVEIRVVIWDFGLPVPMVWGPFYLTVIC
jgi:hypothetical protein